LLKLLYGATPKTGGEVKVDGRIASIRSPRDAISRGLLLAPEDRKKEGIIPIRSVQENINLSARRHHVHAGMVIDERWKARMPRHSSSSSELKRRHRGN